jgi:ADP-ribose pyrophosphatase
VAGRLKILQSKMIYSGRLIKVKVDRIVEPGGVAARREVVCHAGSVVVVPRLADGGLVLVRQYRYAARQRLWELVAGGLEPGESPRQAARRELQEEAGYRARSCKLLFDFYPSPGILSERMFLVEARGLTPAPTRPDPDESIEVGLFSPAQLQRMLRQKMFHDGKTLVGILWFLQNSSS